MTQKSKISLKIRENSMKIYSIVHIFKCLELFKKTETY